MVIEYCRLSWPGNHSPAPWKALTPLFFPVNPYKNYVSPPYKSLNDTEDAIQEYAAGNYEGFHEKNHQ